MSNTKNWTTPSFVKFAGLESGHEFQSVRAFVTAQFAFNMAN